MAEQSQFMNSEFSLLEFGLIDIWLRMRMPGVEEWADGAGRLSITPWGNLGGGGHVKRGCRMGPRGGQVWRQSSRFQEKMCYSIKMREK